MTKREGIAVKSTVGRLGAAFAQRPNDGVSSIEDIDISRVRYIDYETGNFPLWNVLHHFIHKRIEYESEKELRAFTTITTGAIEAAAAGNQFEVNEAGLLVPVNVETLIQTIYIAPRAPAVVEQADGAGAVEALGPRVDPGSAFSASREADLLARLRSGGLLGLAGSWPPGRDRWMRRRAAAPASRDRKPQA